MRLQAIFGGTFDPVHPGHIDICLQAHIYLGVGNILLMPNSSPPHKNHNQATPYHRLAMLKLATQDHQCLEVSELEMKRAGVSYSSDTVSELVKSSIRPVFIMGWDSFKQLHHWHEYQSILAESHFCVFNRSKQASRQAIMTQSQFLNLEWLDEPHFEPNKGGQLVYCESMIPNIESNRIRLKISDGQVLKSQLHPKVSEYIKEHKLYE
ncbi:MAG: nicotinate (nicotinamide) nucleotide adenylyltransferase [bacterium]